LLWLSKEKGNNLPKIDPEPTIIFAAKKTAKKKRVYQYYKSMTSQWDTVHEE